MLSLLKVIGGPGSIGFLAMCSAFGLVLARVSPRTRQIGRIWLLSVYTGYVALGLPFIANYIAAHLSSYQPISDLASLKGTDAIIVLDGDNRLGRVRETHRLFEVTSPRWVIVSGSEWLMTGLIETGIPADRLITDFNASTTLDQMHRLPQLLNGREATRVVIIASRLQMPRVAALRVSRDAIYEHFALAYYRRQGWIP